MSNWTSIYFSSRILIIGLLGFSSGLPLLLTLSTLGWWLVSVGIDKKTIGLMTLVGMPYTWKFLWSPFVDKIKIPYMTKHLGQRRGWLLLSQLCLAFSIFMMGQVSPTSQIETLVFWATLVAFWSATQDIIIDAYRIEILDKKQYGAGAGIIVNGYRIGMLASGAGALLLSDHYSWSMVYGIMASLMGVGILTTLCMPEPKRPPIAKYSSLWDAFFAGFWGPFLEFTSRHRWWRPLILVLILKVGDNLIAPMSTVFYHDLGFSGTEIAYASKFFGIWMTFAGALACGWVVARFGIMKGLLIASILHVLGNGSFLLLEMAGHSVPMLCFSVALENTTNGLMTGAFVSYMSALCNINYTATQYAVLSSIMGFTRTVTQASSGFVAAGASWTFFFTTSLAISIPGILLLVYMMRQKDFRINS